MSTPQAAEGTGLDACRALFEASRAARQPSWLAQGREQALERFLARGFPTTADEAWRKTSVAAVARRRFERPQPGRAVPEERLRQLDFGGAFTGWELVFVDGRYRPELSSAAATDGVHIRSLRDLLAADAEGLRPWLALRRDDEGPFEVLNAAFVEDGALLEVEPGATPSAPIHIIYFSTGEGGRPTASHPRTLIRLGRASQATVVETYGGAEGGEYLTNAVTEAWLGDGAVLDHYKLERESDHAFHLATLRVHQDARSSFTDHSLCVGGALARNDIVARLEGEGGECSLRGLFMTGDGQHHDTHSVIDHAVAHCTSRELYKGILTGAARGVFHGRIVVRPDAQKTDAHQVNRNLLLSREALVDSTPQLEIFADDVKCKHGSTTGQLDEAALFYLRSRGIAEQAARRLLTYAFASDVVGALKVQPIRVALEAYLHRALPGAGPGEVVS
jgi:Fe-S cluster assembly protein SufD